MRVVFVHGACVIDAQWWWNRMVEPLSSRGLSSVAVELPSCGNPGESLGDYVADVAAVRAVLSDSDEPTVVCGHSYGGTVITGAAAELPSVRHLVYVTAVVPDAGQSQAAVSGPPAPGAPRPWVEPGPDGTVGIRADLSEAEVRAAFLGDCDEDAASGALRRLARQSATAFGQPAEAAAWRDVPATYVLCTDDQATPPDRQRQLAAPIAGMAERLGSRVVELDSGHHPFLSRPGDLAAIIADRVG